jgi:hypothetical protein
MIKNYIKAISLFSLLTSLSFSVYGQDPVKRVLVEESTGTWCASCGYGSIYFEHLENNYPNTIPVAVHTGPGGQDPMAVFSLEVYMLDYFSGSPTFVFDRKDFPSNPGSKPSISASNPWENGLDTLDKYMDLIYNQAPLATVGIDQTYNEATRELSVTITSNFIENTTGEFRLNCFILEDSVVGDASYDQANSNFSGWTGGPAYLQELIDESHPIVGYVHNHVLRAALGDPEGATASIPTTVNSGSSYSKTFTYTLPNEFNENHINLVGLVQRYGANKVADREIVNANSQHLNIGVTDISELANDFIDISIYPNPIKDHSSMEFYVNTNSKVSCDLINVNGQKMKSLFDKNFKAGEYKINIDASNLSNGIYFLNFTSSNQTIVKKIIINK